MDLKLKISPFFWISILINEIAQQYRRSYGFKKVPSNNKLTAIGPALRIIIEAQIETRCP